MIRIFRGPGLRF